MGQKSENDHAQNQKYDNLDKRVAETYVENSKSKLSKGTYDTYIKAFRWASDRLDKTGGIIGFVSNGSWIDNHAMDGFRYCLEKEFSSIYVFNLRGNQRTSGETSRKEGGKIFGSGSRTPISITILVKNPNRIIEKATIYYHDIGDYLSREEKLKIISDFGTVTNPKFKMEILQPNDHNDWINHRNEVFGSFIAIGDKDNKNIHRFFNIYSGGVLTSRDSWCYNFSKQNLKNNLEKMFTFYNEQLRDIINNNIEKSKVKEFLLNDKTKSDKTKISWSDNLINDVQKHLRLQYSSDSMIGSIYRPYCKCNLYYGRDLNERVYQMPKLFPTKHHCNLLIQVNGVGSSKAFSPLITKFIPNYDTIEKSQCFPLYWYEEKTQKTSLQSGLFSAENSENDDKYIRHDGVTNFIHNLAKEKYGHKVTKEDIFYYVYGILHSEDYRTKFATDLKKMLPRIPLVDKVEDFWAFSDAGRDLAKLHLNYEDQAPLASVKVYGEDSGIFTVDKMKFKSKDNKSEIIYNKYIRITNIPEIAYEYLINGKSAIEWILDRYQIRVDKDSQIKNDPNDWAIEHDKPRYILDLLLSVISLSVATVKIIKSLPKLSFEENNT